jgi:hypothetical protein
LDGVIWTSEQVLWQNYKKQIDRKEMFYKIFNEMAL